MIQLPILAIATFLLSLLTVGWLKQRFSQNLLDIPNDRSSHSQPTPRGGGLGFIIAFATSTLLTAVVSHYFPQFSPVERLQITFLQPFLLQIGIILTPLAIAGTIGERARTLYWRFYWET